jgi:hypothetical protein
LIRVHIITFNIENSHALVIKDSSDGVLQNFKSDSISAWDWFTLEVQCNVKSEMGGLNVINVGPGVGVFFGVGLCIHHDLSENDENN